MRELNHKEMTGLPGDKQAHFIMWKGTKSPEMKQRGRGGLHQSVKAEHLELPFPAWMVLRNASQQNGSDDASDCVLEKGRVCNFLMSSQAFWQSRGRPSDRAEGAVPDVRLQQSLHDSSPKWCFSNCIRKPISSMHILGCPTSCRANAIERE